MNSIHPNETKLAPTMRRPHKDAFKSISPGPNTYPRETNERQSYDTMLKNMTPGQKAPAYTIRERYSK